jgi:hypothetical protein
MGSEGLNGGSMFAVVPVMSCSQHGVLMFGMTLTLIKAANSSAFVISMSTGTVGARDRSRPCTLSEWWEGPAGL